MGHLTADPELVKVEAWFLSDIPRIPDPNASEK
jgi:hypothetical protein